jgi:hypothetical protein
LLSIPSHAQLISGDNTRAVIAPEIILRKDRLFMPPPRRA